MGLSKELPTDPGLKSKLPGQIKPGVQKRVMVDLTQIFFPPSIKCGKENQIIRRRTKSNKENCRKVPLNAKKVSNADSLEVFRTILIHNLFKGLLKKYVTLGNG